MQVKRDVPGKYPCSACKESDAEERQVFDSLDAWLTHLRSNHQWLRNKGKWKLHSPQKEVRKVLDKKTRLQQEERTALNEKIRVLQEEKKSLIRQNVVHEEQYRRAEMRLLQEEARIEWATSQASGTDFTLPRSRFDNYGSQFERLRLDKEERDLKILRIDLDIKATQPWNKNCGYKVI